MFVDILKVFIL